MEIFKNFGLDPVMLVAQIVNFLIVFIILKKVLYKPFLSTLRKRQEQIELGLKSAEEGQRILLDAKDQEHKMLKKAEDTAEKIVLDAKNEASKIASEIEETAKQHSEKMLEQAKAKIEIEARETEERLTKKIGAIAIAILEKTLPKVLDRSQQEEVLRKATSSLKHG